MKKIRITFNAPVTLGFVLLCFFATLLGVLSSGKITEVFFMTYHSSLANFMTYVRFFTHVLGHEGWEHFIGNASYLLLLGPMLEEKYGSKALLEVIGMTALATGLINYIFFWDIALCGASGVVFAFIVLSSFSVLSLSYIPCPVKCDHTTFLSRGLPSSITASRLSPARMLPSSRSSAAASSMFCWRARRSGRAPKFSS